jgi:ATP-binding protein involved in chromosome partitioning
LDKDTALNVLKKVIDPELGDNIVNLNMVRNLVIDGGKIELDFYLTTPACPLRNQMKEEIMGALKEAGTDDVTVNFKSEIISHKRDGKPDFISREAFEGIKNIVPVYSTKGGVGKSTVAANIAVALAKEGARVALLDLDIYGPSIPRMFGISGKPDVFGNKVVPIHKHGVSVMSLGFLLEEDKPLIWRGPLANSAIKQLFEDILWEEIDYMIVDMPPGTGDIQITFAQEVPVSGAIYVTTPQRLSVDDTVKGINMFGKMGVCSLGVVSNMSRVVCPHCGKTSALYSRNAMDEMISKLGLRYLGDIPFDVKIAESGDSGTPAVIEFPESEFAEAFMNIARESASAVSMLK